jgi:hypothetical protein
MGVKFQICMLVFAKENVWKLMLIAHTNTHTHKQ